MTEEIRCLDAMAEAPVPAVQPYPSSPHAIDQFQLAYTKSILDGMEDLEVGKKLYVDRLDLELTKGEGKQIDIGCYLQNLPKDLCDSKLAACGLESVDQLMGLLRAHIKAAGYTVMDDSRFEREEL